MIKTCEQREPIVRLCLLAVWLGGWSIAALGQTAPAAPEPTAAPAVRAPGAVPAQPSPAATGKPISAASQNGATPSPEVRRAPLVSPTAAPVGGKSAVPASAPASSPVAATAVAAAPKAEAVTATATGPALSVIRGQIALTSGGRPLRAEEALDAVVYFRPDTPVAVAAPTTPYVISTERKTFVPRVLPIPVGASVRFPNNDPILHNVFSTAKEASFDLGLYGRSEGEAHLFTQPGVIKVYCNVHHAMVAHILVMDTPFFAKPDAQGRFRLVNVPSVPGELFVWHERAQLWRKVMTAGAAEEIQVPLELSKRRILPHLNKTGQPYRRTRPDEY